MQKTIISRLILYSTLIYFTFSFNLQSKAQTLNSIAITAGATAANQKFIFADPPDISIKKYLFGYNASIFGELFTRDFTRWVTEIQYNQKGSLDIKPEANYSNQIQYLCWNNYLKIRYELFSVIPYVLLGPRLEYNMTQSTSSPAIQGNFMQLQVSPAIGAGVEFVNYYNIKFFVEGFYNPDVIPAYITPELHVYNSDFELRAGLKYEFAKRKESCNTPTYVE